MGFAMTVVETARRSVKVRKWRETRKCCEDGMELGNGEWRRAYENAFLLSGVKQVEEENRDL